MLRIGVWGWSSNTKNELSLLESIVLNIILKVFIKRFINEDIKKDIIQRVSINNCSFQGMYNLAEDALWLRKEFKKFLDE